MKNRPTVYSRPEGTMTMTGFQRSAMAPATGAVIPIIRLWVASAKDRDSRPQPMSMVIGLRNRPKLCRVP